MKQKQIRLVVLAGMSGSGKDTIKNLLVNDGYKELEIFTTRPKRSDDESGYDFISYEEYTEKLADGAVLESREYHIATSGETWYYGTYIPDMSQVNDGDNYVVIGTIDNFKTIKGMLNLKALENDIIIRFIPISEVLEREHKDNLLCDIYSYGCYTRIDIDDEQTMNQVYENVKYTIDYIVFQSLCD